jgi:hypothetical protein
MKITIKFIIYTLFPLFFLECSVLSKNNSKSFEPIFEPKSISEYKFYVDSLINVKTNKNFVINERGLREYEMIDKTEKLNTSNDTMYFELSKEYKYSLTQSKKDQLIQALINELKEISELKKEYYILLAEKKYDCYFNKAKLQMVCPEFISNFTFYNRNAMPLTKYYWWRGNLRSKDEYIYQNGVIKDTVRNEF